MSLPIPKPMISAIIGWAKPKLQDFQNIVVELQKEEQKNYNEKFVFIIDNGIFTGMTIDKEGRVTKQKVDTENNKDMISVVELLTLVFKQND